MRKCDFQKLFAFELVVQAIFDAHRKGDYLLPVIMVQCLPWGPIPMRLGALANMMKRWPSEPNQAL